MTDTDKIAAYDELRERTDAMGFACIGEALDELDASEDADG